MWTSYVFAPISDVRRGSNYEYVAERHGQNRGIPLGNLYKAAKAVYSTKSSYSKDGEMGAQRGPAPNPLRIRQRPTRTARPFQSHLRHVP